MPAETVKGTPGDEGHDRHRQGRLRRTTAPGGGRSEARRPTLSIALGGLFSAGNARTIALTSAREAAPPSRRAPVQRRGGRQLRARRQEGRADRHDGRELPGPPSLRLLPHGQRLALPPVDGAPRPLPGPRSPSQRRPGRRVLLHQHEDAPAPGRRRLRPPVRHPPRRSALSRPRRGCAPRSTAPAAARQDAARSTTRVSSSATRTSSARRSRS